MLGHQPPPTLPAHTRRRRVHNHGAHPHALRAGPRRDGRRGLTHELQPHPKPRAAMIRGSSSPSPAQSEPSSDRESDAESVSVSSLVDQGAGSSGTWSGTGCTALVLDNYGDLSDEIRRLRCSLTHSAVPSTYPASSSASSSTRSKAGPSKEVKMPTLTRTLTVLYSTTLISLLTSLQLALLAHQHYIASVVAQERLERIQVSHARAPPSLTCVVIGHTVGRVLDMEALEVPLGWVERVHGTFPILTTFISHLEDNLLDDSDLTHEISQPLPSQMTPRCASSRSRGCRDAGEAGSRGGMKDWKSGEEGGISGGRRRCIYAWGGYTGAPACAEAPHRVPPALSPLRLPGSLF
ncbi:hypothetical protein BV22DRAFT_1186682 [Leucogyrophana mollusca]|uniref:Uncharacterized protein n=1 Tax=Leucogyrophana mollusca TaxID=85980 RepID=A0ACB8AYG6_9AGAM|nr:hypothetical protein BV22DRAFT_1186682 [Leucogyrophana mollusca]